jgi:hypothetical protein
LQRQLACFVGCKEMKFAVEDAQAVMDACISTQAEALGSEGLPSLPPLLEPESELGLPPVSELMHVLKASVSEEPQQATKTL